MAVTLTTADLQQPTGELAATLFPGENLETLLTGWLAQATTLVQGNTAIAAANHNAAAAAHVYYRAYGYKVLLMASDPNDISVGERSETFAADQRKTFAGLRDYYLAQYTSYEVPAATSATPVFFGRARAR